LAELLSGGKRMRIALFAPPVPVVTPRFPQSATLQCELNLAASLLIGRESGSAQGRSLLYSFHIDPSSLDDEQLLLKARQSADSVLSTGEGGFYGIHLHFTNLAVVALSGGLRVQAAHDLVHALSATAKSHGLFLWVTDSGPASPAFLDDGAAFASYSLGGSMRQVYPLFKGLPEEATGADFRRIRERRYGKVLGGPWDLTLLSHSDLRKRDWKVQENGRFPNVVPVFLREGDPTRFRVEFAKPNNVAVMERINEERERELVVRGNARPGKDIVGRSGDAQITVWAN